jgi:hypothetical protein
MIARGFRSVAWVAAIGTAALGCYMLSLRVASERSELASLDHRIQAARQHIRMLHTELGTRGRLQQLEEWNADVLALSAPAANQFVRGNVSLARFDIRAPTVADRVPVQMAAAETAPAPVQPSAPVRLASADAALASGPAAAPLVHRASLELADAAPAKPAAPAAIPAASRHTPAPSSGALLDESTLRMIGRTARAENRGGGARD